MTREFDYLAAAVRSFFRPETPLPPREGLDWNEVVRLADAHAVTLFLYQAGPDANLRETALERARLNLASGAELNKLLGVFEQHAICVIPLKGPALDRALYGARGMRTWSDLDLLVRSQDLLRAKRLLEGQGYRLSSTLHWPVDTACFRSRDSELSFTGADGVVSLDVHWRLLPGYFPAAFDDSEVWANRSLSPEQLLLFLCAHGTKHCWERLGWICDVARLVQIQPAMNWSKVFRSDASGSRMVSVGLLLASDLLGVDLPPAAIDTEARALAADVIERFHTRAPILTAAVESARFSMRAFERTSQRTRFLFGIFLEPTEAEYRALQLPPVLYWLYYPFRPLRLALKYARRLGSSLGGRTP